MTAAMHPFPLVPRRRFAGAQFGERRSPVRGTGSEVAGSRPYRPGDPVTTIDWGASARLSAARGEDEFVVREHFAEQAPRVALVVDRRPAMALYGPPFPWLDKRAATDGVTRLVAVSAAAARGDLAYVDDETWIAPGGSGRTGPIERQLEERRDDAAPGALGRGLELLFRHRGLFPAGSFVFVVSDFLDPPAARAWLRLRGAHWDVTPVVVQDPVWEQSFPPVGGVVLPLAAASSAGGPDVLLSSREAARLRTENEARLEATLAGFGRLGFDPVVVDSADASRIGASFAAWAERRRRLRRRTA